MRRPTEEPERSTTEEMKTEEPETTMRRPTEEPERSTTEEEVTTTEEMKTTTMVQTEMPTTAMYNLLPVEGDNNSCSANQRAFTLEDVTLEECVAATVHAEEYVDVVYISISDSACYGCMKINREKNGFMLYELVRNSRRELSELEKLRAENAALKKELARRT